MKVVQSCPTLCDRMDYRVHGILQARILEWVAFPFSRGSSQAEPPEKPISNKASHQIRKRKEFSQLGKSHLPIKLQLTCLTVKHWMLSPMVKKISSTLLLSLYWSSNQYNKARKRHKKHLLERRNKIVLMHKQHIYERKYFY